MEQTTKSNQSAYFEARLNELESKCEELEKELSKTLDEISAIREDITENYTPVDPYVYNGVRPSDFH